jgi:hypothetical protein
MLVLLEEDGEEKKFLPLDVNAAVADMLLLERFGSLRFVDLSRLVVDDREEDFLIGGVSLWLFDTLSCDGLLQLRTLIGEVSCLLDGLLMSVGGLSWPFSFLTFGSGVAFVACERDKVGTPVAF